MRPRHITYFIWLVIALLGVVSLVVPPDGWHIGRWNLRYPTLAEALDLHTEEAVLLPDTTDWIALDTTPITTDSIAPADTVSPQDTIAQKPVRPALPAVEIHPSKHDTRAYLSLFYQALDSADMMPVRVVHYGDSQIEEDRITNILRERWQQAYGGGGVGLIPLHQTIPTRSIAQRLSINGSIQSPQGGPKRYLVYGPRSMRLSNNDYGVMGQVAMMDSNLVAGSEDVVLTIEPIAKKLKTYNYFSRVRLLTDSAYVMKNFEFTSREPIVRRAIPSARQHHALRAAAARARQGVWHQSGDANRRDRGQHTYAGLFGQHIHAHRQCCAQRFLSHDQHPPDHLAVWRQHDPSDGEPRHHPWLCEDTAPTGALPASMRPSCLDPVCGT